MDIQNPLSDYVPDSLLTTQGDIIVRGATDAERLAIGTALQLLKVNAGATALEYADIDALFQKARVSRQSAQVVSSSTVTLIQFLTTQFDPDSIWDGVNYRFVPTRAGYYYLKACLEWNPTAVTGSNELYIQKNGTAIAVRRLREEVNHGLNQSLEVSIIAEANGTTDYFDVMYYQVHGATVSVGSSHIANFFEILGPF